MGKAGFIMMAMVLLATALVAQTNPAADTAGTQKEQDAMTTVTGPTPAPAVLPASISKTAASVDNLSGLTMLSCSGFYYYNKTVETDSFYDWYSGDYEEYTTTHKNMMYAMLLNAGYISNGVYIGATLGVLTLSSKREGGYNPYYYGDHNSSSSISLFGPRVAYYHGKKNSKMIPFAAFEFNLVSSDFYSDSAMRIGGGVLLQPKPHLGISFGLDYLKFGDQEDATNIIGVVGLTGIIY